MAFSPSVYPLSVPPPRSLRPSETWLRLSEKWYWEKDSSNFSEMMVSSPRGTHLIFLEEEVVRLVRVRDRATRTHCCAVVPSPVNWNVCAFVDCGKKFAGGNGALVIQQGSDDSIVARDSSCLPTDFWCESDSFRYGGIRTVHWAPNGTLLATLSGPKYGRAKYRRQVAIWEASTGRRIQVLEHDDVQSVKWSADGKYLATGGGGKDSSGGRIVVWEATSWVVQATFEREAVVVDVDWDRSSTPRLATRSHGCNVMSVWSMKDGAQQKTPMATLEHDGRYIDLMKLSPDGQWLAVTGGQDSIHGKIRLWHIASQTIKYIMAEPHVYGIHSMAWHPTGDWLVIETGTSVNFCHGVSRILFIESLSQVSASVSEMLGNLEEMHCMKSTRETLTIVAKMIEVLLTWVDDRVGKRIRKNNSSCKTEREIGPELAGLGDNKEGFLNSGDSGLYHELQSILTRIQGSK